jgi:hypothetical protein
MSKTVVTTLTATGFAGHVTINVKSSAPGVATGKANVRIAHFDANGNLVPLVNATPTSVTRPAVKGAPIPPRPVDKNLATVLAKVYTGTLEQVAAQAAVDYETLAYP